MIKEANLHRSAAMLRRISVLLILCITGCGPSKPEPTPTPTIVKTATPDPTATPEMNNPATPTMPAEWMEVSPGLEIRGMTLGGVEAQLVRADLEMLEAQMLYDPREPKYVSDWQRTTNALLVVNAGFFEPDYTSSGQLIVDGKPFGQSFAGRESASYRHSGVLVINRQEAGIHLLTDNPYQGYGVIDMAVEGLPVLIYAGQPVDFTLPDRPAARTCAALDEEGKLVFVIVHAKGISLYELRDGLLEAGEELKLVNMLNLDGGPSTGLVIRVERFKLEMNSGWEVPNVMAFFQK